MQAGNAGGLFQHAAALLRLGLDDLADAALMHHRRRARAGRGVGEQDVHVAGAHLAAVDAIGGALLALDAARDIELLVLVELRRRLPILVVDVHRHFGVVARRPIVGAGEDHVVHVGGAQRLVRGLAHHPAQRLDQVGLAAAVRSHHAGQPRLDVEIGGLDKGFEAEQAQSRQFHVVVIPSEFGRSIARDATLTRDRSSAAHRRGEFRRIHKGSRPWTGRGGGRRIGRENESGALIPQQKLRPTGCLPPIYQTANAPPPVFGVGVGSHPHLRSPPNVRGAERRARAHLGVRLAAGRVWRDALAFRRSTGGDFSLQDRDFRDSGRLFRPLARAFRPARPVTSSPLTGGPS